MDLLKVLNFRHGHYQLRSFSDKFELEMKRYKKKKKKEKEKKEMEKRVFLNSIFYWFTPKFGKIEK